MRDGRDVSDHGHKNARALNRPYRGFATRSGSSNEDLDLTKAVIHALAGRVLGGSLSGESGRLSRSLEPDGARAAPSNGIALRVCQSDYRIVERRLDVSPSDWD